MSRDTTRAIEQLRAEREAQRSRKILVLDKDEMKKNIVFQGVSSPDSAQYKLLMPRLQKYAGKNLNATEITNILLSNYNDLVQSGELARSGDITLFALLDLYGHAFTRDKEIIGIINRDIAWAQDQTIIRKNASAKS